MNPLNPILNKIVSKEELIQRRNEWRQRGLKVVFTNGCFDLIHPGHIEYLARASALGDRLVVALNSDISVKKIKGPDRPVMNENARSLIMASFQFVDTVVMFDEETPASLISSVLPDILVKGGDYKEDEIVGGDTVKKNGGKVIVLPFVEHYSTTSIIQKIKKMRV